MKKQEPTLLQETHLTGRDTPHWQRHTQSESERMKNKTLSKWKPKTSSDSYNYT
jgi:hypothetical protein